MQADIKQDVQLPKAPSLQKIQMYLGVGMIMMLLCASGIFYFVHLELGTMLSILLTLLFLHSIFMVSVQVIERAQIKKWKKTVIDSLPLHRREVKSFHTRKDLEFVMDKNSFHTNKTSDSNVFLEVSFLEEEDEQSDRIVALNWFEVHEVLEPSEAPYLEFQFLGEALPNGLYYGMYNPKLYVPKGTDVTWVPFRK